MNEFEFNDLIDKYKKGQLSDREKEAFDRWLDTMPAEERSELSYETKVQIKQKIFGHIRGKGRDGGISIPFRGSLAIYKIAASILLAAFSFIAWLYLPDIISEGATIEVVAETGIKNVILPDKTIVWLKGNSALTYPSSFSEGTRDVTLKGEALFEVSKDSKHPFIIHCGDLRTTVLGTSFNIKNFGAGIEVVVLTGKVSLSSSNDTAGIVVLPNQRIVYTGIDKVSSSIEQAPKSSEEVTDGTEYDMHFEDNVMKDVIMRIESKFNIEVSITDERLAKCMITADCTDQSLEQTLSMISQALALQYEVTDSHVVLSGRGCE